MVDGGPRLAEKTLLCLDIRREGGPQTLSAKWRFNQVSSARKTTPMPPTPSTFSTR
jgi:hypothetical protein